MKRLLPALAALLLAILVWLCWPRSDIATAPAGDSVAGSRSLPSADPRGGSGRSASVQPGGPSPGRSTLADALNSPATDVGADLRIVSEIVDAFRSNFPREGNPVGTNAEITAALTGKNRLHLAIIPPDHPAINRDGELCDRWGTPFFFHAESAARMEIRSAGPDRRMWTDDDVVHSP